MIDFMINNMPSFSGMLCLFPQHCLIKPHSAHINRMTPYQVTGGQMGCSPDLSPIENVLEHYESNQEWENNSDFRMTAVRLQFPNAHSVVKRRGDATHK